MEDLEPGDDLLMILIIAYFSDIPWKSEEIWTFSVILKWHGMTAMFLCRLWADILWLTKYFIASILSP